MVFGGIGGILPPEPGEIEEPGSLPSINVSRENGDLQDMYRRTLAASWTAHSDEFLPDQLIEDIFAGGRGIRSSTRNGARSERADDGDDASISDTASRMTIQDNRMDLVGNNKWPNTSLVHNSSRTDLRDTDGSSSLMGSFPDIKDEPRKSFRSETEISEFDVRDDLRTWEITVKD